MLPPPAPDAPSTLDAALRLAAPFFGSVEALGALTPVEVAELPVDARGLLAHDGHMTESLESRHGCPVSVLVRGEERDGASYARHSLLARQSDGATVQSGVVRVWLAGLPGRVSEAIMRGETPLGRVLIDSNVLRRVELLALWRIAAGTQLAGELSVDPGAVIYGRSARILLEGTPAVELLEIVKT
jgi:chorismate-pyruvate lyase